MSADGVDDNVFKFKPGQKREKPDPSPAGNQSLPHLLIDKANPDKLAFALRDIFKATSEIFNRGTLSHVVTNGETGGSVARQLDADGLVKAANLVCRPYVVKDGVKLDAAIPRALTAMFLNWGDWGVPALNGITTAPLLGNDGSVRCARGYDAESGLFCEGVPDIADRIPQRPSKEQAKDCFTSLRRRLRTLAFADAETIVEGTVVTVDQTKNPGADESGYLCQLFGAVVRPSLWLAPGLSVQAPQLSGSGAGKDLAVRCIMEVAFGRAPYSIAQTTTKDELDKQISAALLEGGPSIMLSNFNDMTLTSSALASALTDRPSRVRIFGKLLLVTLSALAFVAVTGNGLTLSKDIIRRFISVMLDARVEDAENREFTSNLLADLRRDRADVLVEILTVWRWGRQNKLPKGVPFGSYEQWAEWVRDPLLALGCQDPVARLKATKARDPARQVSRMRSMRGGTFSGTTR
jgi:hypothetical protein